MDYKIIITGTTGMVGEGVLLECLTHPQVSEVLALSRRTNGYVHTKLKEYLVPDFLQLAENDEMLKGYDACFFCGGVSSIGMKEAEFTRNTYDTTTHVADVLLKQNPQLTFIYVSGAGTNANSKMMWARVKGRTENTLMAMPFKAVFNFRPGFMKLTEGQKFPVKAYKYFGWMYPVLRLLMPNGTSTLKQVAQAMISCLINGYDKKVLEVKDINKISNIRH